MLDDWILGQRAWRFLFVFFVGLVSNIVMTAVLITTGKRAWPFANLTVFYLPRCARSSRKMAPSLLYLNVVRDEASSSGLRSPQSLQCLFLGAGLLTPVCYMVWGTRRCTRQETTPDVGVRSFIISCQMSLAQEVTSVSTNLSFWRVSPTVFIESCWEQKAF